MERLGDEVGRIWLGGVGYEWVDRGSLLVICDWVAYGGEDCIVR